MTEDELREQLAEVERRFGEEVEKNAKLEADRVAQEGAASTSPRNAVVELGAAATMGNMPGAVRGGFEGRGVSEIVRVSYPNRSPPRMPNDPSKAMSWMRRMTNFLEADDLVYVLTDVPRSGPVNVISCGDTAHLESMHGRQAVKDHRKCWHFLSEAIFGTDIEERGASCGSVPDAWQVVREWSLPVSDADQRLLLQQLENVVMHSDENPKHYFARFDALSNKTERELTQILVRQLSGEYDMQKAIIDINPDDRGLE